MCTVARGMPSAHAGLLAARVTSPLWPSANCSPRAQAALTDPHLAGSWKRYASTPAVQTPSGTPRPTLLTCASAMRGNSQAPSSSPAPCGIRGSGPGTARRRRASTCSSPSTSSPGPIDDSYDTGIVCSTDTDLLPALDFVATRFGRERAETAAWLSSGKGSELRLRRPSTWCHRLELTDYESVRDPTDYSVARLRPAAPRRES